MAEDEASRLLELNDIIDRLSQDYPRQAKALELVYFGGMTQEEAGAVLDVSRPTVARDLSFARAWLAKEWKAP